MIENLLNSLIDLLAHRCLYVEEVGKLKKAYGVPPLDKERWKTVIEAIRNQAKNKEIPVAVLAVFFEAVHKNALKKEDACSSYAKVKEKDDQYAKSLKKLRISINELNSGITDKLNELYCFLKQYAGTISIQLEVTQSIGMITYFNSLFDVFCEEISKDEFLNKKAFICVTQKIVC